MKYTTLACEDTRDAGGGQIAAEGSVCSYCARGASAGRPVVAEEQLGARTARITAGADAEARRERLPRHIVGAVIAAAVGANDTEGREKGPTAPRCRAPRRAPAGRRGPAAALRPPLSAGRPPVRRRAARCSTGCPEPGPQPGRASTQWRPGLAGCGPSPWPRGYTCTPMLSPLAVALLASCRQRGGLHRHCAAPLTAGAGCLQKRGARQAYPLSPDAMLQ